jgi:adenylosuccinate lyase
MRTWNTGTSFFENIAKDPKINKKLPVNKLKKLFDFSYHTKKIDIIFKRNLKK